MYGVGCHIRRQAGHGAAHSLATYLEAAELISRLAEADAQLRFFESLALSVLVLIRPGPGNEAAIAKDRILGFPQVARAWKNHESADLRPTPTR